MTITHHPSAATLAAFATGQNDEGRRLVVATHLESCPECRQAAGAFQALGGVALEDGDPVPLSPGARERMFALLDGAAGAASPEKAGPLLSSYGLGAWRWIGPGIYWREVEVPAATTRVFMLKAAPGTPLPDHTHTGIEWTAILQGAFRHELGRYGVGDFDEADDSVTHRPVVEAGEECICLVAMEGELRLRGIIGRLMQPFVRI